MEQLTKEQLEQVYREHPEWRTEIEAGKWYKLPDNANFLFCVTELLGDKNAYGYGWCKYGKWYDADNTTIWGIDNLIPAADKEVSEALIAEANRRYKVGDKINRLPYQRGRNENTMVVASIGKVHLPNGSCVWALSTNGLTIALFRDGQWATVNTSKSDLNEDIQGLKDKYPNYNWTIIAEAK